MNKMFFRLYQLGLKLFVLLYPFPRPKLFVGKDGLAQWLPTLAQHKQVLVVSDATLVQLGVLAPVLDALEQANIRYTVFSDVDPNPSIDNVESGLAVYRDNSCDSVVAIGGGSVMDCAKLIAARVSRPKKSVRQLKGLFKIRKSLPPFYAIPTTAGTGSETTIVAVVSDKEHQQKYAVTDLVLAPKAAILLPELTTGLPPHITATTGMDALTHAVESYIGKNSTAFTREKSLQATKLIFANILHACRDGKDLQARENMLRASFYAGEAFTRASVGYVHAIAHQFGALYNTPHGLANAILLPKILRQYGSTVESKMMEIAQYCEMPPASDGSYATAVINKIEALNEEMGIPQQLSSLKQQDVGLIANMAYDEAHPDYPVPAFFERTDFEGVLEDLLENVVAK